MKITREALLKIIQEEYASAHEQGKTLVKEDWVDQLYNALYALEDNVEGVVIDTELEQVYRKFHSMLKAHILEKSKVRDASRKEGGGAVNESVDPFMIRYIEIIKEKLVKGKEEQKIDPQLADELLSMVAGIEGTSGMKKPE